MHRRLAPLVALVLLLDGLAAYQIGVRDRRPPSFRRGGAFETTPEKRPPDLANGPFSAFGMPGPPDGTSSGGTGSGGTGSDGTGSDGTGSGGTSSGGSTTLPVTSRGATGSAASGGAGSGPTLAGGGAASNPQPAGQSVARPALGTYQWAVNGSESATGFGSRSFPPQMTMVAHAGTGDPGEVVLDLTYSSNHQEREILGCRSNGEFLDFEAGQVRFGIMAQSNQGDYRPPLLLIPQSLAAGETAHGTSQVTASDGSVERTEAWTVTVNGPVTLQIAGQAVPTWQVTTERHSLPGSAQADNRTQTFWFDPGRHLWVKFVEKQHGQQSAAGFTFTYDNHLEATLTSFTPA